MLRIRGTIGDWPVDLALELDAEGWRQLAAHLPGATQATHVSEAAPAATRDDGLWRNALELLRQAGSMEGTALLGALEGLAGSPAAGKRLLVRLRHHPRVQVDSGEDTPLYRWLD